MEYQLTAGCFLDAKEVGWLFFLVAWFVRLVGGLDHPTWMVSWLVCAPD